MIATDEKLAKSIMDAQPESVMWFQPVWNDASDDVIDFEIRYCNAATARLFQQKQEDIIGKRLLGSAFIDADAQRRSFEQCLEVWRSGDPKEFINRSHNLDCYFQILRSKLMDGIISVARDCTEQFRSEQKLKNQADLLNRILDTSPNAIFACEAIRDEKGSISDFRFLKVNKMFLTMVEATEDEILATTVLSLFPTAKSNGLFDLSCGVVENGTSFRKELKYVGAEQEAWLDVSMAKLGEQGLVVTFTDITDGKRDKETVLQSAQYLQNAIDTSQTGITIIAPEWDEKGEIIEFRYRLVNKTFSSYVGSEPAQLKDTPLSQWFPLYKAQGTFDRYKEIYRTGEPQRFDLHYVKDGYDVWVDIMAKKQGNEIFVTFHDVTSLKKAQLAQEALVADLRQSNANLEDFAFAASHDLQEPLRKIHFFSHKLRNEYFHLYNEEGVSMFLRMETATQRMRELINDLLDYSQLHAKEPIYDQVDLGKVVQDVISDLETVIQEKGAKFTFDVLPVVKGERQQLRQLFQNLLSNALKYSHQDRPPFVSIRVRSMTGRESGFSLPAEAMAKPYYSFEVTDNGIGFDPQNAEKIFNVFQRLHSREEYSGTGVGLAIVKKVIDNHNGCIIAESEPGKGATFRFILPA